MGTRNISHLVRIIDLVQRIRGNYFARRIGMSVLVLYLSTTATFVLYRLMPLGPYEMMLNRFEMQAVASGEGLSVSERERMIHRMETFINIRPDEPLHIQYLNYMEQTLLHLDFGVTIQTQTPVFELLFSLMPWSIFISLYGFVLGTSTSLVIGALMANYEGGRFDMAMTSVTILNMSIPYYLVAITAILILGWDLGWFPTRGKYGSDVTPGYNLPFMRSVAMHAFLPVMSLFVASFGGALSFRGNAIREKGKEYIRVARLRGISENRIGLRYVGRNAFLPIYTGMMMGIAGLFGGNIIVETIFQYRAVGMVTFGAIGTRDYPLLMGSFLFYTILTLIGILIADMTYGLIDPRVKGGGERESF